MRTKTLLVSAILSLVSAMAAAGPEEDREAFQAYFLKQFPGVSLDEFGNGIYAIHKGRREEWKQMEEFPGYEFDLDAGEELFHRKFADGATYADCFPDFKKGIKQNYPVWDRELGEVITLERDINRCREKHGEAPLEYAKGPLAQISAYLAYLSRGKKTNVVIPAEEPRALAAYEDGKRFFYSRRGQLNFACSQCHIQGAGKLLRGNLLSPALGQVSHYPSYRKHWGAAGTLHRFYEICLNRVRAVAFKPQSREYRNLEYFHTYMSNGMELNGPGSRQ